MSPFLDVACPCGRTLRARREQAGSTIRCWSCGREVAVPRPRARRLPKVAGLGNALRVGFSAEALGFVAVGAGLVTGALLIPGVGPWLALGLLAAAARAYEGRFLGGGSPADTDDTPTPVYTLAGEPGTVVDMYAPIPVQVPVPAAVSPPVRPPAAASRSPSRWRWRPARVGAALVPVAAAVLLALPLLVRDAAQPWFPSAVVSGVLGMFTLTFAAGWLVMPLLVLLAHARDAESDGDDDGPRTLPARAALAAMARRRPATFGALLSVPAGLVVLEAAVALFAWLEGYFPLLANDLFPPAGVWTVENSPVIIGPDGRPRGVENKSSDRLAFELYGSGLRHGFTLSATIPASLRKGIVIREEPSVYGVLRESYPVMRAALTFAILLGFGLLMAAQARWLGAIASGEPRPAAAPRASPVAGPSPGVPVGT
jgi:hypothetical protein